jgi:hypothetical protein
MESEPLLESKPQVTSKRNKWLYIAGGALAGAGLFSLGVLSGAGIVLHSESSDLISTTSGLELISASTSGPGIMVSNKYLVKSESRPQYPWLSQGKLNGATILEPFKVTSFNALDVLESDEITSRSGVSYNWKIERKEMDQNEYEIDLQLKRRTLMQLKGVNQEEIDEKEPVSELVAESSSSSFVHNFDQLGLHRISLEASYPSASAASGVEVMSSTATVMVKYVRQEIHSVDDEDRTALLSAWQVLMNTDDSEGVAQYGDDFMSFTRLTSEHNNFASDKTCDHLHDGMGFVPAHVSLTRLLEASLQSVNPAVTLPYWEYTIDVEDIVRIKNADFREWRNVPMFTDKWFGSSDEVTGRLKDSVFVDFDLKGNEYTTATNGYGLIRSPWNNLKSPSFTRFFGGGSGFNEKPVIFVEKDQMSTCSVLQETLAKDNTLALFNGGAAGQAHGPIHMFTGGQSGTKSLTEHMTKIGFHAHGKEYNQYWGDGVTFMFLNIKGLWRYGLWSCSDNCDETTEQSECACSCNTEDIVASPAYDALFSSYIEEWNDANGEGGDGMLKSMLDLMCNVFPEDGGVVMGDHASSAASSDPSFWVIHGTVERWLQLMRIQSRFTSESWDTEVFDSNVHPDSDTCAGHAETDSLVFGQIDGQTFTNGEYYSYLDPSSANTPYVYDNFEWSHCEALGYDISSATI